MNIETPTVKSIANNISMLNTLKKHFKSQKRDKTVKVIDQVLNLLNDQLEVAKHAPAGNKLAMDTLNRTEARIASLLSTVGLKV